uniref:Uncharacterized protein n=1 Tax=Arundo donax TaxID=35708 RepID=A0A0A9FF25_ARUDO
MSRQHIKNTVPLYGTVLYISICCILFNCYPLLLFACSSFYGKSVMICYKLLFTDFR